MAKPLTIVIVAKNHWEQTKKCIEALEKYTDPQQYKILFMDNSDAGVENSELGPGWLTGYCRGKIELKYQYYGGNIGWVQAVNKAYSMCDTEYVLTIHNDCYVNHKDWLPNMLRRLEDEKIAAVGPMITFAMGPQSVRYINIWFNIEPKYLLGLFFMCRMSVLNEVREFNKNNEFLCSEYGLGDKEELELCWIIRQLGYKFKIARDVLIEHDGEKSFVETLGSQQAFYDYQNKQLKILQERLGEDEVQNIFTVEDKNPVKLMVGLLTRTEYIHYRNMLSILKVWGYTTISKNLHHIARGHAAPGRNQIVKEFLKSDCTHLIFIDDDMYFEQDAIVKLLNHDVDIASGIAYQRGEPHAPCVFLFNSETKCFYPIEISNSGLRQVDAVGGFFFLIKRKVLEQVEKPWFIFGDTSLGFNDNPDPDDRGIGEDIYFSAKAKLAGFDVWCDSDLVIGHLGRETEIDDKFAEEFKTSGKLEKCLNNMGKFKKM